MKRVTLPKSTVVNPQFQDLDGYIAVFKELMGKKELLDHNDVDTRINNADIHVCTLIYTPIHGSSRIYMDIHGYTWILVACMDAHGYTQYIYIYFVCACLNDRFNRLNVRPWAQVFWRCNS